jgi:hypothetical protein
MRKSKMEQDWKDPIKGRSESSDNGNILQSYCTIHPTLWHRKLGTNEMIDAKAAEFPSKMCPPYYWTEYKARYDHRRVDMPRQRDNTKGSRTMDD